METNRVILVADRNPRIRDFVQRELKSDGHQVFGAENGNQLRSWLCRPGRIDVLVIDPDMPGVEGEAHLMRLLSLRPNLAVILHCLADDSAFRLRNHSNLLLIEKSGQSIDQLKLKIQAVLHDADMV